MRRSEALGLESDVVIWYNQVLNTGMCRGSGPLVIRMHSFQIFCLIAAAGKGERVILRSIGGGGGWSTSGEITQFDLSCGIVRPAV